MYITVCVFQLYIYGSDKMSFTAILETVPGKNQKIKFYRPPELQKEVKHVNRVCTNDFPNSA